MDGDGRAVDGGWRVTDGSWRVPMAIWGLSDGQRRCFEADLLSGRLNNDGCTDSDGTEAEGEWCCLA